MDLETKGSLLELGKGFINTAKNFGLADRKIEGFGDALKGFDGLKLVGLQLSDLGKTLDFNVDIFKTLSQTGAGFGKSVIQLRNAATSAREPQEPRVPRPRPLRAQPTPSIFTPARTPPAPMAVPAVTSVR